MLVDALCQSKSEHPDAFGQDGPAKGCGYTLACSLFVSLYLPGNRTGGAPVWRRTTFERMS